MSYRAASTISQDCDWGLLRSLWKSVCNYLGIEFTHILSGFEGSNSAGVVHGER